MGISTHVPTPADQREWIRVSDRRAPAVGLQSRSTVGLEYRCTITRTAIEPINHPACGIAYENRVPQPGVRLQHDRGRTEALSLVGLKGYAPLRIATACGDTDVPGWNTVPSLCGSRSPAHDDPGWRAAGLSPVPLVTHPQLVPHQNHASQPLCRVRNEKLRSSSATSRLWLRTVPWGVNGSGPVSKRMPEAAKHCCKHP